MTSPVATKEITDWLLNAAEDRLGKSQSRRSGNDRNATTAELKQAKKLAEKMAGRKLDQVSTTVESNIEYCDMQTRIADKLEAEGRQLAAWADVILASEKREAALIEALRNLIERMKWDHNGAETCEDSECSGCLFVRKAEAVLKDH